MTQRILISCTSFLVSFFAFASVCSAASMSLGTVGVQHVGDTFSVPVYVSAGSGESLNALSASITFPPQQLRVVLLGDKGIVDLWAQKPSYSNTEGIVSFQGVTYNPGFSGVSGKVITVTFRALAQGTAQIAFHSPSILANDGQGTEILTSSSGSTVVIQDAVIKETVIRDTPLKKQSVVVSTSTATTSPIEPAVNTLRTPPVTYPDTTTAPTRPIPDDIGLILGLLFATGALIALGFLAMWYVWHRMHHTRRRLLRHIASTDIVLQTELFELHDALKKTLKGLRHEQSKRDLSMEEKRILMQFSHLVEKTEHVLGVDSPVESEVDPE